MEWHVNPDWKPPHAVKPWNSLDSTHKRTKEIFPGDSAEAIRVCLNCKRTNCPGDCDARLSACLEEYSARAKRQVNVQRIVELYLAGNTMYSIARELSMSRELVRYWIKNTNTKRPPRLKKEKAKESEPPVENPCIKCRTAYLCKTRRWTCSDKREWDRLCGQPTEKINAEG